MTRGKKYPKRILQRGVINAGFVGKIGLQSNALQNLISGGA
jgi:hypothetical protein